MNKGAGEKAIHIPGRERMDRRRSTRASAMKDLPSSADGMPSEKDRQGKPGLGGIYGPSGKTDKPTPSREAGKLHTGNWKSSARRGAFATRGTDQKSTRRNKAKSKRGGACLHGCGGVAGESRILSNFDGSFDRSSRWRRAGSRVPNEWHTS